MARTWWVFFLSPGPVFLLARAVCFRVGRTHNGLFLGMPPVRFFPFVRFRPSKGSSCFRQQNAFFPVNAGGASRFAASSLGLYLGPYDVRVFLAHSITGISFLCFCLLNMLMVCFAFLLLAT